LAKMTGIPMTVTCGDGANVARNITNDIRGVTLDTSRDMQDVTGVDKLGKERTGGINDATCTLTGAWNPSANPTFFSCFKDIATTNIDRTLVLVYPGPATFTATVRAASMNVGRAESGEMTQTVSLVLSGGAQGVWS